MKIVLGLAIVGVIAVAAVFYSLFGGGLEQSAETIVEDTVSSSDDIVQPEARERQTGEIAFGELMALDGALECQIAYDNPELEDPVSGTYFLSNERVRGDFEMTVPELGGSLVSSMIMKDNTFYSWSRIDGQAYGVKMEMDSGEQVSADTLNEPVPANALVSYDCVKWDPVDASIFEPPSDVLFRDAGELLNAGMEYGTVYEESI